jgi:hypothetical protein
MQHSPIFLFALVSDSTRKEYQKMVREKLKDTRLKFRDITDPLFPNLPNFMAQFEWMDDRYKMYALQGPSRAAKTSFIKSLFANPFVLTVQNATTLNLSKLVYGVHDALVLDNINSFKIVLDHRALLQANTDEHLLGESATGCYAYYTFLWAMHVVLTLDSDVNAQKEFKASDWLRSNVLLDVLPSGATCFIEGVRPRVPMSAVPPFKPSEH